ncbi:MAG: UMP kinase [Thermoprotei archaeon]
MNLTVKIGGHLLDKGEEAFRNYGNQIKALQQMGHKVAVVVGGGERAREWIRVARNLGVHESTLDEIGILASRLNAYVQIAALGSNVYPHPPTSIQEFDTAWSCSQSVVLGGLTPGQSTTAVATIVAERTSASRILVLTNVDGVYSHKPGSKQARLLKKVKAEELGKIVLDNSAYAGTYDLLDHVALKILQRSHIPAFIVNGEKKNIIVDSLKENLGTEVIY